MLDMEGTIIPLKDADEILRAFGIGTQNKAYQRWRRDDGFRWVDLEDVLSESRLVLNIDWRACVQGALDTVARQLDAFGFSVDTDLNDEGNQGHVEIDEGREAIRYADNDDFDNVIQAVNRLIKDKVQYRMFRSCKGTDGWQYGLLTNESWKSLETIAPNTMNLLFFLG